MAVSFPALSYAQSAFEDPGAVATAGAPGADFVTVNSKVEGGAIALGSSSQVVVLFRNDSIKPVLAGDISLYPSSNVSASVSQNQCSLTPLDTGAVCAVALNIKGLQAGKYRIEMLIKHDGRSRLVTATVSGDVEAGDENSQTVISDIEAIPNTLDFGSLTESQTMVRSVVLRNITSNPITINDVRIETSEQSGFKLQSNCGLLDTGQACLATVTWAPQKKGSSTGILVLEHDGPTGVASIPLDGKYDPETAEAAEIFPESVPGKGLLISTADEINFGTGISTSAAITTSLVNVGDTPLTIQDVRMSNNEDGISIGKGGCRPGSVLEPVEACPLTLSWSPSREGSIIDDIQVRHTGARGILVMPVRGNAAQAVNKDKKAFVLTGGANYVGGIPSLLTTDMLDDAEFMPGKTGAAGEDDALDSSESRVSHDSAAPRAIMSVPDVRGVLDGFTITSLSPQRAIVSGPGGSRVLFNGEETVIGGVLWTVAVRNSAVEFDHAGQKVLLLFDKSLSSVNRVGGQSVSRASVPAPAAAVSAPAQ